MKDTKKAGCTSSRCFALGGTAVLFVVYQVIGLIRFSSNALFNEYSDVWLDHTTTSTLAPFKKKKRNLARDIVNEAYESTYIIFDEACHEGESFTLCVARLHSLPRLPPPARYQNTTLDLDEEKNTNASSNNYRYPWWFETMLRDANEKNVLFGQWHFVRIENPPMQFCSIEKVACSEWRGIGCALNKKIGSTNCLPPTSGKPQEDAPRGVFLRDPLERFLSGFMDKCMKSRDEKHCEPQSIYYSDLAEELMIDPRVMFEAYVDTLPLKWNLHFFPESLHCDGLFREIPNYDFVGHMGEDFYADLQVFGRRYGDNMTQQIENSFKVNLRGNETITRVADLPPQDQERERKASKRLEEFYTPRTVRRVLEYMSIDYVRLGLKIPEWAEEMLQKEHAVDEKVDGARQTPMLLSSSTRGSENQHYRG
jgi:hypothetical protein